MWNWGVISDWVLFPKPSPHIHVGFSSSLSLNPIISQRMFNNHFLSTCNGQRSTLLRSASCLQFTLLSLCALGIFIQKCNYCRLITWIFSGLVYKLCLRPSSQSFFSLCPDRYVSTSSVNVKDGSLEIDHRGKPLMLFTHKISSHSTRVSTVGSQIQFHGLHPLPLPLLSLGLWKAHQSTSQGDGKTKGHFVVCGGLWPLCVGRTQL